MAMGKRRSPTTSEQHGPPNPHGPEDRNPYPNEPPARSTKWTKNSAEQLGENMFDQQGQRGYQGSFPHAESHDTDDDSWAGKRASIRGSMNRRGSSY